MSQKDVEKLSQQLKINLRTPPPFPPPSCPRCSSGTTKFCYYNNYSESQPRYFCKNCRRYWTHGGVVRNLPSTRKRGRTISSSPTSQISKPPPSAPLVPPPLPAARSIGTTRLSVGCVTLGAPITDTTKTFGGGGGGLFNQMPLKISQGGELGNVNPAFGAVNAGGFGGRAPLPPDPLTPMLSNLSPLDDFHDFGFPFLQQPQLQLPPPPQPPTVWTSLNMAFNCTSSNNFLPISRDLTADANVVNINEWPEFNDMDTYKPASP